MKGGPPGGSAGPSKQPLIDTGTTVDLYAPVYVALMERGVSYLDARAMDISVAAVLLGAGGNAAAADRPVTALRDEVDNPAWVDETGNPGPGSAPPGMKPPSWWRGDKNAFDSMVRGARELDMTPPDLARDPEGGEWIG